VDDRLEFTQFRDQILSLTELDSLNFAAGCFGDRHLVNALFKGRHILVLGGLLSFAQVCRISCLELSKVSVILLFRLYHLHKFGRDKRLSLSKLGGVNELHLSFLEFLQLFKLILDDRQQTIELGLHSIHLLLLLLEEERLKLFAVDLTLILCLTDLLGEQFFFELASLVLVLLHK